MGQDPIAVCEIGEIGGDDISMHTFIMTRIGRGPRTPIGTVCHKMCLDS